MDHGRSPSGLAVALAAAVACVRCGSPAPVPPERYGPVDALFETVDRNVAAAKGLRRVADIDHSRLAARGGAVLPPARVLIFSDAETESRLLERDPRIGLDLPLRVLAFEERGSGEARLIGNRFPYLASRYGIDRELGSAYEASLDAALAGVPPSRVAEFPRDEMPEDGIVTLASDYAFEETLDRVQKAIAAQDDTIVFGLVDFSANAKASGIALRPATLVLFGAPVPGARAMQDAPTLGLDAFCQKLLVWEGADRAVRVSLNDLLVLAARHGVGPSLPLRLIDRRMRGTFGEAIRASKQPRS